MFFTLGDPFHRLLLTVAVFSFSSLLPGTSRRRIWVHRSACDYVCVVKNTAVCSLTIQKAPQNIYSKKIKRFLTKSKGCRDKEICY